MYWGTSVSRRAVTPTTERLRECSRFAPPPALGCCCVALTLAPYPPFSFFHMHAQKCGFTYEGRLRKSVKKDGKFLDQLLYGLLRSDIADAPDA
jgi:hypothetical protein